MTQPFPVFGSETTRRRILFAAALIDPITGALVSEGLRVSVDTLARPPIVNRSGYFVWLAEEPLRPTVLTIVPERAPFEADTQPIPPLPDPPPEDSSLPVVFDDARLRRIFLRPTAAYPFPDNALVLRGRLRETAAASAPAVGRADVCIEWYAEAFVMGDLPGWIASAAAGVTAAGGEFAAALALPAGARPVAPAGKNITLRLRFERPGGVRLSDAIELPAAPNDPVTGRANSWMLNNSLAWSDLTPA
jgi:hypothetical protein